MTPARIRRLPAGLALAALCLLAQSNRDAARTDYRASYRTWREADPSLELDAATAGEALAARAEKVTSLATAYGSAHAAALKDLSDQQSQNLLWLRSNGVQPVPDLAPGPSEIRFSNSEITAVSASIAAFANDTDRGILLLRQAYQREQGALEALKASILDRQMAEDKAAKSVSATEQNRGKAMQEFTFLAASLAQSADSMNQESALWATYYTKLADAARMPATGPVVSGAPVVAVVRDPAPPRPPSITPVPLSRYVGTWSFRTGSMFFGSQPEVVDMVVHEDNGHATGTFSARFKLPPGSTGDPVVRFEFSGDFKPTKKQTFALKTNDGAAGSVELNPGVAFNELEVNFNIEAQAGKIRQGDVLLLKQ